MRLDPRAPRLIFSGIKKLLNPRPRSGRAHREISQVAGSSDKTGSSVERPSGNFSIHHPEAGLRTAVRKDVSPGEPQDAVRPTSVSGCRKGACGQ